LGRGRFGQRLIKIWIKLPYNKIKIKLLWRISKN
jgi:hypothetical protein